jgi:hypothetical protein
VDVNAGVDVVKRIPAVVVGVFIDDEIVGAIPAPIGADGPVPRSDFKVEAAGKPETVAGGIEALDAVSVRWPKVFETAVFEGMIEVKAPIVRGRVAVPMVVIDMRSGVDMAGGMALGLRLSVRIITFHGRRRNVTLIGARRILATLMLLAALREKWEPRE